MYETERTVRLNCERFYLEKKFEKDFKVCLKRYQFQEEGIYSQHEYEKIVKKGDNCSQYACQRGKQKADRVVEERSWYYKKQSYVTNNSSVGTRLRIRQNQPYIF